MYIDNTKCWHLYTHPRRLCHIGLFFCLQNTSGGGGNYGRILIKLSPNRDSGTRNRQIYFGNDLDYCPDSGVFGRIFSCQIGPFSVCVYTSGGIVCRNQNRLPGLWNKTKSGILCAWYCTVKINCRRTWAITCKWKWLLRDIIKYIKMIFAHCKVKIWHNLQNMYIFVVFDEVSAISLK